MGVALGLRLGDDELLAGVVALGLHDADRLAVHEQHIVGRTGVGRELAHRHARRRAQVEAGVVLHLPAGGAQAFIDDLAGLGLWGHVGSRIAARIVNARIPSPP
ncbi:hypothetical protein ACG02S_11950 [Roseateles sp. DC23W]|uniref:Uncharacterized protein n=1 Tax=Pelomonas dachongensis TaxID=3299029 RepID=A0ABW7EP01_9BURK